MTDSRLKLERLRRAPLRAVGEIGGCRWEFRATILAGMQHFYVRAERQDGSSSGGGGIAPMGVDPDERIGRVQLVSPTYWDVWKPRILFMSGVAAKSVARVVLEDPVDGAVEIVPIQAEDCVANFFVSTMQLSHRWVGSVVIARDHTGAELDRRAIEARLTPGLGIHERLVAAARRSRTRRRVGSRIAG